MTKRVIKTELIEEYINKNHLSKTAFCKKCKIAPSTLKAILSQSTNVGIVALFKIVRVLNIEICELFYE